MGGTGIDGAIDAVLDSSDALVFAMALANVFGLSVRAPVVKRELASHRARFAARGL